MFYIYKITSPSGKIYIGITKDINRRFKSYEKLRCKNQIFLYNSILKYGWENHIKEILFTFNNKLQGLNKEKRLIKKFKKLNISLNISNGGEWCSLTGKNNPKSKVVYQYNKKGNFLKLWDSLSDVSKKLNISVSELSSACRLKTFYCKNYYWCFKKDIKT
jgi:predicted GIY-YIG superfamily endonuclease